MYDALNAGRVELARLRRALAALPLPTGCRWADRAGGRCQPVAASGRPDQRGPAVLPRPRPRRRGSAQMIPGWPYSFVAALETGRSSWTAVLDAVRLGPADDATAVTAAQLRDVVDRLVAAGQWQARRPEHRDRADTGYDVTRLAYRAGRPAGGAGRAAALGPGAAPARPPPRRPGRPGARPSTARSSPWPSPRTWPTPQHTSSTDTTRYGTARRHRLGPGATRG